MTPFSPTLRDGPASSTVVTGSFAAGSARSLGATFASAPDIAVAPRGSGTARVSCTGTPGTAASSPPDSRDTSTNSGPAES